MNPDGQSTDSTTSDPPGPIDRVFGAENRARLLTRYFAAREAVTPANAWRHVYHLLLWIDRTTALAHCYVVHINPQAVLAAYGDSGRGAAKALGGHLNSGRLMDLATWLARLTAG